jgi:type IX secretion system PorP/SprF family membrane protein
LKISFGLKAGINMLQIGLTNIALDNPDDPAFMNNIERAFMPNFGFGVFAHTNNYYIGFSVPDLILHDYLNNTIFSSSDLTFDSKKYYLMAGASYPISDKIVIKPSGFMSMSNMEADSANLTIEADLTALFIFDNKYAGGIMIRSGNAIAFLVGIVLNNELEFGYSFDMLHSNPTARFNGGGHEIVLKYNFKYKRNETRRPLPCSTFQ